MDQTTGYGQQVQAAIDAIERSSVCYVTRIEGIPDQDLDKAAAHLAEAWKLLEPAQKYAILAQFINLSWEHIQVKLP